MGNKNGPLVNPNPPSTSDQDFIKIFEANGPAETARLLDIAIRNVFVRRRTLEKKMGMAIIGPDCRKLVENKYPNRIPFKIKNGVVIIGSDAHYWPGEGTTAHRGFLHLCKELSPELVILNGDVLDGARISRHARIQWAKTPTLKEEIEACQERTDEILKASPRSKHLWLLGNHCMRFETKLSSQVAEFEGVQGFMLKEQFPEWDMGISAWINDDVVIKHRFKGGVHATHNNTLAAGKSMVTGHLHSLKVTPYADYNGNRFGIDTGTLSDPYGEHAAYAEDAPLNHRSGFIVLTFIEGRLLWPEIVHAIEDGVIEFRGQLIKV